ncbi:MerR family transcriptional regulator [Herbaspirillum rubrisubalbicans Os34]|uniref:MerR family transcriptional regulator n=1 Tax=Herbaspirillum rubrisubalbicans Os34 TaxID=1235827 RepID=A0A6M3ZYZ3_9BURK|nr:MerR family transcriptional regulator [Herbaspirillum rubrisubalbicans]QJQ03939.1 MerR family transcriptional regulator [Herbaspirillum rubrisubalbicans Os34]
MFSSNSWLNASETARRLGVSIKALRLYEQQGLINPGRTPAGYRAYRPDDIVRAAEIVTLRTLGLSLAQVARVLDGDPESLNTALSTHEAVLDNEIQELVHKLDKLRSIQADLARGQMPSDGELTGLLNRTAEISTAFELPWPWGGEWFEIRDVRPLNYIIGSLGSGKTRLALRLAETLPNTAFVGLDRLDNGCVAAKTTLETNDDLRLRVNQVMAWLADEGATRSDAMTALLVALEKEGPTVLVIDMVEQGLDQSSQKALMAHLRQRAKIGGRPMFLMTRSSAILDLAAVGPDEAILLCPANHSPPSRVVPYPGAPGYEAVATCLATPEVRERIARRPEQA